MNEIVSKKIFGNNIVEFQVKSPLIAKHAFPGQFVILRIDKEGERVPFTICNQNLIEGTITLVIAIIGETTKKLANLNVGDKIQDILGPLGKFTDLTIYKNILLIGAGVGAAVIVNHSKSLYEKNKKFDVLIGAKTKDLLIYKDYFEKYSNKTFFTTDDGSYGLKGFITEGLNKCIENNNYDCVLAVGPMRMMQAVTTICINKKIPIIVSMNPIMLDGTGMCGACKLTVEGCVKHVCVDGPEFDGAKINWEEAINRLYIYEKN